MLSRYIVVTNSGLIYTCMVVMIIMTVWNLLNFFTSCRLRSTVAVHRHQWLSTILVCLVITKWQHFKSQQRSSKYFSNKINLLDKSLPLRARTAVTRRNISHCSCCLQFYHGSGYRYNQEAVQITMDWESDRNNYEMVLVKGLQWAIISDNVAV